ncbi:TIGR03751 family conjugal transfer lipoprotein [Halorhodospira halophila]|uniref:TIGR03751 family conjugal transfer lipoprotein n=1 Tax=Halorhodospira TaxID=85108 RepID=UPI001EE94B9C|nr:TIGR03751 family conjugal transfer lipoprotein [Halorhodospira sp. 9622]
MASAMLLALIGSTSALTGCARSGATQEGTPQVYPEGPRTDEVYEAHMNRHAGGDIDDGRQQLAPGSARGPGQGESADADDQEAEASDDERKRRVPPVYSTPAQRLTDGTAALAGYTRQAHDELEPRFGRVPNPSMVMYVYPHLATPNEVPVPGYSTTFPMFERDHYALPGEPEAR